MNLESFVASTHKLKCSSFSGTITDRGREEAAFSCPAPGVVKFGSSSRGNTESHLNKKLSGEIFNISAFCQNVFNRSTIHTNVKQIQYIIQLAYIATSPKFLAKISVECKIGFT